MFRTPGSRSENSTLFRQQAFLSATFFIRKITKVQHILRHFPTKIAILSKDDLPLRMSLGNFTSQPEFPAVLLTTTPHIVRNQFSLHHTVCCLQSAVLNFRACAVTYKLLVRLRSLKKVNCTKFNSNWCSFSSLLFYEPPFKGYDDRDRMLFQTKFQSAKLPFGAKMTFLTECLSAI